MLPKRPELYHDLQGHPAIPQVAPPLSPTKVQSVFGRLCDSGFQSLDSLMAEELSVVNRAKVGLQIADALLFIHSRRVLHLNLGPKGVLVHKDHLNIKLIDFSECAPFGTHPPASEVSPYTAPEQTHRIQTVAVDCRTDVYIFGCLLYLCLAGQPPFICQDTDLMQSVLSSPPTTNNKKRIPPELLAIVDFCTKKSPDDRYQSLIGVCADLQRLLLANLNIPDFTPSVNCLPLQFSVAKTLVGRDDEIARVLDRFSSACSGGANTVFILGDAGIGKTAFVTACLQSCWQRAGGDVFILLGSSLMESSGSDALYCVRACVRSWMAAFDTVAPADRQTILEAFERENVSMKDLECLVDSNVMHCEASTGVISIEEARRRILYTFRAMLKALATIAPVVLVFGEIGTSGELTAELITSLVLDDSLSRILIIGSARSSRMEKHSLAPLVHSESSRIELLRLGPLSDDAVKQWLWCSWLRDEDAVACALDALRQTGNNPCLIAQTLQNMSDIGGLLVDWQDVFDEANILQRAYNSVRWSVDSNKIQQPIQLLSTGLISELPESALRILKTVACFGASLRISDVESVGDPEVASELALLTSKGLLVQEPIEQVFSVPNEQVVEHVLSLMTQEEIRQQRHAVVTHLLNNIHSSEHVSQDEIFRAASALNVTADIHSDDAGLEMERVLLNLQAAQAARHNGDCKSAIGFADQARQAIDNLSRHGRHVDRRFIFWSMLEKLEGLVSFGQSEVAERYAEEVLQDAENSRERLIVLRLMVDIYTMQNKTDQVKSIGASYCREMGLGDLEGKSVQELLLEVGKIVDSQDPDELLTSLPRCSGETEELLKFLSHWTWSLTIVGEWSTATCSAAKCMMLMLGNGRTQDFDEVASCAWVCTAMHQHEMPSQAKAIWKAIWSLANPLAADASFNFRRSLSRALLIHSSLSSWMERTDISAIRQEFFEISKILGKYTCWERYHANANMLVLQLVEGSAPLCEIRQQADDLLLQAQECHLTSIVLYAELVIAVVRVLTGESSQLTPRNTLAESDFIGSLRPVSVWARCHSLASIAFTLIQDDEASLRFGEVFLAQKSGLYLDGFAAFAVCVSCFRLTDPHSPLSSIFQDAFQMLTHHAKLSGPMYSHYLDAVNVQLRLRDGSVKPEEVLHDLLEISRIADKSGFLLISSMARRLAYPVWSVAGHEPFAKYTADLVGSVFRSLGAGAAAKAVQFEDSSQASADTFHFLEPEGRQQTDSSAIVDVTKAVTESSNIRNLLLTAASSAIRVTNASRLIIFVKRNEVQSALLPIIEAGPSQEVSDESARFFNLDRFIKSSREKPHRGPNCETPISFSNSLLLLCARTGSTVQYSDKQEKNGSSTELQPHLLFGRDPYLRSDRAPKSLLCIPWMHQKNVVGVLYLEHQQISDAFTQQGNNALRLISAQCAVAWANLCNKLANAELIQARTQAKLLAKEKEASRLRAQEAAEQAERRRHAFYTMMSHDLRAPLSTIVGGVAVLRGLPTSPLKAQSFSELLDMLESSSYSMAVTVDQILELARIEGSNSPEIGERAIPNVDLQQCIDEAVQLIFCGLSEFNVFVFLDRDIMVANSGRVGKMVASLLCNAKRVSLRGGDIMLSATVLSSIRRGQIVLDTSPDPYFRLRPSKSPAVLNELPEGEYLLQISVQDQGDGHHPDNSLSLVIAEKMSRILGGSICSAPVEGAGLECFASFRTQCRTSVRDLRQTQGNSTIFIYSPKARMLECLRAVVTRWRLQAELSSSLDVTVAAITERGVDVAILCLDDENSDDLVAKLAAAGAPPRGLKTRVVLVSNHLSHIETTGQVTVVNQLRKPVLFGQLFESLRKSFEAGQPSASDSPSPIRILVVDDDLTTRKIAQHMFRRNGAAVETVAGGREALDIVRDHNFEVICLDWNMPHMSGMETLERLNEFFEQNPDRLQPHILSVTGISDVEIEELRCSVRSRLPFDFVQKPMTPAAVMELVARATGERARSVSSH